MREESELVGCCVNKQWREGAILFRRVTHRCMQPPTYLPTYIPTYLPTYLVVDVVGADGDVDARGGEGDLGAGVGAVELRRGGLGGEERRVELHGEQLLLPARDGGDEDPVVVAPAELPEALQGGRGVEQKRGEGEMRGEDPPLMATQAAALSHHCCERSMWTREPTFGRLTSPGHQATMPLHLVRIAMMVTSTVLVMSTVPGLVLVLVLVMSTVSAWTWRVLRGRRSSPHCTLSQAGSTALPSTRRCL